MSFECSIKMISTEPFSSSGLEAGEPRYGKVALLFRPGGNESMNLVSMELVTELTTVHHLAVC